MVAVAAQLTGQIDESFRNDANEDEPLQSKGMGNKSGTYWPRMLDREFFELISAGWLIYVSIVSCFSPSNSRLLVPILLRSIVKLAIGSSAP